MAKYIELDALTAQLQRLQQGAMQSAKVEKCRPCAGWQDAQEMANQLLIYEAELSVYEKVLLWARSNAVEGSLILDPWPDGGGIGRDRLKPEQNKNFVQVEGGEKGL